MFRDEHERRCTLTYTHAQENKFLLGWHGRVYFERGRVDLFLLPVFVLVQQ